MLIPRLRRQIEVLLIVLAGSSAAAEIREAPNPGAQPVNQLSVSGNACGPAALLASYRCGSESWQAAAASLPGSGDREQLGQWIRRYGLRPSATLKGRMRWSTRGINVEDLVEAANEMNRPLYLPMLVQDGLFLSGREKPEALLERTRERLDKSLSKGVPPLLSLRRFVLRKGVWVPIQGHFVTVTAVPRKITKGESGFRISYFDPWGGKRCEGYLKLPDQPVLAAAGKVSPCLVAELPAANIGKNEVHQGETTAVIPASVIGRW